MIDIATILFSFIVANLLYLKSLHFYDSVVYYTVMAIVILPMLILNITFNPYSGILRRDNIEEFIRLFTYTVYYLLSYLFITFFIRYTLVFSRFVILLTYTFYLVLCFFLRVFWKKQIISGGLASPERISLLVVANKDEINSILDNLNQEIYNRYDISGLCICDEELSGTKIREYDVLCNKSGIYDCILKNNIKEVFFAISPEDIGKRLAGKLINEGIGVQIDINSIFGIEPDNQIIDKVGVYHTLGLGLFVFRPAQLVYLAIKRFFDVVLSIIAMIPLGILSFIVKIAYVLDGDNNTIFYHQTRIGKDGIPFQLYKFRSMVIDADERLKDILKDEAKKEEWDTYHKFAEDPRVTKVGSVLRKTSLDEFPQFINVLKGEMSIVGPRPLVEGELKMHNGLRLYERVKPGITGWWACNGRSNISYKERLELEYYYVKNCSFLLDVITLLRTVNCVIKKTGAQ